MPIKGDFTADFSSFTAAVDAAQVTLRQFEANSNTVATSLQKMADSLSGTKMIADATLMAEAVERLGGVSTLTEKELQGLGTQAAEAVEKLKLLGKDVPANLQAIADSAKQAEGATSSWGTAIQTAQGYLGAIGINATLSGLASFTASVFNSADAVHTMSLQLGISAEAVQGFKTAAEQSGSSLDTVGKAVTTLGRNLAGGDKSTVDALNQLGLKFQDVRAMRLEDAFLAVTDAAAKTTDKMVELNAGSQLMGKGFAELAPAIANGFRTTADAANKWSTETVESLARAKSAWQEFGNQVVIITGDLLGHTMAAGSEVTSGWDKFAKFLSDAIRMGPGAAAAVAALAHEMKEIGGKDIELPSMKIHQTKEEADAAAAAFKKWKEATDDLKSAGDGWQGTLDTIDGAVVEATKYYLAAGVSQGSLAAAYALTDTQIKAVVMSLEAEKKASEDLAKHQAEADTVRLTQFNNQIKAMETLAASSAKAYGSQEQIAALERLDTAERALTASVYDNITSEKERMKLIEGYGAKHAEIIAKIVDLENKRKNVVNDAVIAELNAQKELNAAYGLTVSGGIAQTLTAYDKMQRALDDLHLKKVDGISQTNQETVIYNEYTGSLLKAAQADDAARDALSKHNDELTKTPKLARDAAAALESLQGGAKLPGSHEETRFGQRYLVSPTGAAVPLGPHGEMPGNWFEMYSGQTSGAMPYMTPPARAAGGPVAGGSTYLVGEKGPELFVPTDSGMILPNNITNNLTNHFNMVDTAENLARRVADVLMRSIMNGRKLGSA